MVYTTQIVTEIDNKISNNKRLKRSDRVYYRNMFGYRRADIEFTLSLDEVVEYMRCQQSIVYFVEKHLNIKLRDYQKKVIEDYEKYRFNILLVSRQCGISLIESILMLHDIVFNKKNVYMVNIGSMGLYRFRALYLRMPFFLKPGILSINRDYILFNVGSIVLGKNGKKIVDANKKRSIDSIFVSDMALMNSAKQLDILMSLSVLVSKENSRIFISSVSNGINYFYELFEKSERYDGDPSKTVFNSNRIYWWQVPGHDEQWRLNMIKDLGGDKVKFDREFDLKFVSYKKDIKG